jgi:type II secretory pathway pseudopilin PulG
MACFPCRRSCNQGFTYIGLMILVAVIGIVSAASLQVGVIAQRRAAEESLLDIGEEFRNALTSYANATPDGLPREPASLQDLLKDPRYPSPRRHLRKLYPDPLTGKEEWGIQTSRDGLRIVGIFSLSEERPIKIGNFDTAFQHFSNKASYRDWVFAIALQPQTEKR